MSNTDCEYLSNQVQKCFSELFNEAFNKVQDVNDSICEISSYLIGENNKYDYILNKYTNVNKELLNRMILSNFLEITYYRRKNGIPIDKARLSILETIEKIISTQSEALIDLIYFDKNQFFIMINDVLLYFEHPSQIYSYNVVQSITKDGFAKKLYSIYSLAMSEHMLTLDDSFSDKELLLYTFCETLINETEKIEFSNGNYPIPNAGYVQEIANILKMYNGWNPKLLNIHKEILENFTSRTDLRKNDENKLLMIEIIISTIRTKKSYGLPLEPEEKYLIDAFDAIDKSLSSVAQLYDKNEQIIASILINNWNYFTDEEMLGDLSELKDVKRKRTL